MSSDYEYSDDDGDYDDEDDVMNIEDDGELHTHAGHVWGGSILIW
jgi:hypothetical protein